MRTGGYGPSKISFVQSGAPALSEVVGEKLDRFDSEIYAEYAQMLRLHPFYQAPDVTAWLRDLVARPEFGEIFDLDPSRAGRAGRL